MSNYDVQKSLNVIAYSERVIEESRKKINETIEHLKKAILTGENTENRIKCFIICAFGTLEEEPVKGLRRIENLLKGHVGECLLVVIRRETFLYERGCLGGHTRGSLDEHYYCGILQSEELSFDLIEGQWKFPIDEMLSSTNHSEPALCDNPYGMSLFGIPRNLWRGLDKKINLVGTSWGTVANSLPKVEIIAGDSEVCEWFGQSDLLHKKTGEITPWRMDHLRLFAKFMELLEKRIPEIPELEEERKRKRSSKPSKTV